MLRLHPDTQSIVAADGVVTRDKVPEQARNA
jgi:hypothetical protein